MSVDRARRERERGDGRTWRERALDAEAECARLRQALRDSFGYWVARPEELLDVPQEHDKVEALLALAGPDTPADSPKKDVDDEWMNASGFWGRSDRLAAVVKDAWGTLLAYYTDIPEAEAQRLIAACESVNDLLDSPADSQPEEMCPQCGGRGTESRSWEEPEPCDGCKGAGS